MPSESPATRPRQGTRAKRKDSHHPVSTPRASHPESVTPSAQHSQEEINRLRDVIDRLQGDRRVSERETGDEFTLTAELRWKINQLENEKLDFTSKHNKEVSHYEAQVARLRAQVERGEAQRQTLEYDVAVARRDAAAERRNAEEKITDLRKHNHRLDVLSSELRQRVSDLQRSLEITQQAREEDQQGLQAELHERDRLLLSVNTENDQLQTEKNRLETLIQEHNGTLHELKGEMERMKRDRERDAEKLKSKSIELNCSTEREEKLRTELESVLQKVKVLEQTVESERAAHLESKFNSEIIQLRMRDLEGALGVEKSSHAEVTSTLELLKQKFGEVERAYAHERDKSQDMSQKLTQLEKDFLNMKSDLIGQLDREKGVSADLIGQLEQEKAESVKLSIKLQEQDRVCAERQQELNQVQKSLVFVQESHDSLLCDIEQLLQQYHQQGAPYTHKTGEVDKHNSSALMDILRRTLHNYNTQMQESLLVLQKLNHEMKVKDEQISELQRKIQECDTHGLCVNEEVKRFRECAADASADADRAQRDLRRLTHLLQEEKTQHTHTQTQINTLQQQHNRDCQEKLSFLHTLYQRLVAGCVLVTPPHSILGSFSWAELSEMVQEHVDALTSDLTATSQKVSCLENVCEGKSAAVESVSAQLKQCEETWIKQREELNTHHAHINNKLQQRIQDLRRQLDEAEGRVHSLERAQSEQVQEVTRLQGLVSMCGREEACLLAACGVLAGCMRALRRQVCVLAWQKAVLQERVCDGEILRTDVSTLLHALSDPGVKGQEVRGQSVRVFRRCVIAVLAAGRFRMLGRSSEVLFRVAVGYGQQPDVCVSDVKVREEEEDEDRVMKMLNSSELLVLVHTCMEEVQDQLNTTECVKDSTRLRSAAQSASRKLFERLLSDVDFQCSGYYGKSSLARRLAHGLHRLTAEQHSKHRHWNSKVMVASLQKHILEFTQRLHSAEVERRNLRLELSRMKRTNTHTSTDTHTACVPVQQFEAMCSELSSALEREQRAQCLLYDQAAHLKQLGLSMELNTGEQLEKDRTLAHAVQSLSEAKLQLKRKNQCLRSLEKQLSQSQQEKQQLQQHIKSTENALRTATKNKESLMSYLKSVEEHFKKMKDDIIISRSVSSHDAQLSKMPRLPSDSQRIMGNTETVACQSLVCSFLDVYQLACSKISSQEREISSYQTHITALKSELHDACLREQHTYTPLFRSLEEEVDCGTCELKGFSTNTLMGHTLTLKEKKHEGTKMPLSET
ncbi:coiled-coil domain-containing protein 171-like [Myxocyprinus asiaticus]|uniref:coiled-coil domain-containing protein 171-like n=1 Tax=Myxocyprinus asiaticus TaxID=70543 RepID=UPI0022234001|nr:coiled-coil domain-containing protein 171-like [Myxocyprinus asiaticus]